MDPRLNNVMGYVKYAKYIWGESSSGPDPQDEDTDSKASIPSEEDEAELISDEELSEI
jgi:hypothetical protein